jgi:PAS domain S-box-containing protein
MADPDLRDAVQQAALDSSPLAVLASDEDGRVVVWNTAAEELFGWSRDEVLDQPLAELGIVPAGEEAERFRRFRDAALAGRPLGGHLDALRRRRDGSTFTARIWPAPLRDDAGAPRGFIAFIDDVTAEERREAQRRADEERFRAIFERSHDAILTFDPDEDELIDASPSACRMLGYPREELLRLRPSQIHADDLHGFHAFVERVRRQGGARTDELVCRGHGGVRVPCEISASWVSEGDRRWVIAIVRDVRERQRMEAELKEAERRYRDLYEHAPFAYLSVGRDGRIRLANRRAGEMLGREDLTGTPVLELYHPDSPAGRPRAEQVLKRFLAGKAIRDEELEMVAADGRSVWVSLSVSPVTDDRGQVVASRSIAEDITARKPAEEQLARSMEDLERANAELTRLAFGVAHDLAAPLRTVSSYSTLLLRRYRGQLDEDADQYLGFLQEAVTRLRGLLDSLLAFARAGEERHELTEVDMRHLADQTLQALAATIDDTGAAISVGDLPTLTGDEVGLGQLVQNLVGNALRHHAPGRPPTIRISAHRERDHWRFEVADDGPGIDPAHEERIFDMFHRAGSRTDRHGAGVGLAICRKIVERHGGDIWVRSSPGQGSTFCFTVPDPPETAASSAGEP